MNRACALVLGGGSCVWDDVKEWERRYGKSWDGMVIAANDIGSWWPNRLDHWVSLHPYKFERWVEQRKTNGFGPASNYWGRPIRPAPSFIPFHAIHQWPGSDSGLFAVQVAQFLGVQRAVLCGIPMTTSAHFAESKEPFGPLWYPSAGYWGTWVQHAVHLRAWVRSVSGATRELLGEPTLDWLSSTP